MDRQEIENAIKEELDKRKKKILNRNALSALFGAFANPLGALGKIFLGREDAINEEKHKIIQDVVLEMLFDIDDAISRATEQSIACGLSIEGFIETRAQGAESVVGVHITKNSGPVIMQPGTHIQTSATASKNVTGLKIGDIAEKE
jgi:hypothetical protein